MPGLAVPGGSPLPAEGFPARLLVATGTASRPGRCRHFLRPGPRWKRILGGAARVAGGKSLAFEVLLG